MMAITEISKRDHRPAVPEGKVTCAFAIHSRMKNTRYVLGRGIAVHLQASFGIATYPQHATDLKGLIAAADQALFAIKDAGKNGVGRFQNA